MDTSGSPRKVALGIFLALLFAMLAFTLFAGPPNRGLLAMSPAGRQIFAIGAATGVFLAGYLLRFSGDRLARVSARGLRDSLSLLTLAFVWSLACFGSIQRAALLLDGPVSTESARLQRPLFSGPPVWCEYFTTVRTESGYTGSLCMERIAGRSDLLPVLGCVPLDSAATIQITRTFLGAVGSLQEIDDTSGQCAKRRNTR